MTACADIGTSAVASADIGTSAVASADIGTSAVAAAEAAAFGGTHADEPMDREALHERLVAVVEGSWWAAAGPPVTVRTPRRTARSSSARSVAGARVVEIRLTDEQLSLATLAHELGHALAGVDHGHDQRFRAAYVDVAALLAGAAAARSLATALSDFGVPAGERAWPPPWHAEGPTFRLVP